MTEMVRITYENRTDLENLNFHDCRFEGFNYDYESRRITTHCERRGHMDTEFDFTFNNVIYFSMQCCESWGSCQRIYDIWADDTPEKLAALSDFHFIVPDRLENELENLLKSGHKEVFPFLTVAIQVISGDSMLIICESVDITQSPI